VRWLVTGGGGMLATDVQKALVAGGHDVLAPDRHSLDITDPEACTEAVKDRDAVFNCAAWTAVDDAESHEDAAFAVNAAGAATLARAARAQGARLVHVSTDYVFDGSSTSPYDEDAPLAPRSAYGRTKAASEWAVRAELPDHHLILRTAWLYGEHGSCFPKTITRLLRERGTLSVVEDQVGQPTWTRDVAEVALRLVAARATGTYHATASGRTSWHGFAAAAARLANLDPSAVSPTDSSEFPRPAPRPKYSVLGHAKFNAAGVEPIGDWQERWVMAAPEVLAGA
jgi:dTDP-4-dehydrorhamnose reductase